MASTSASGPTSLASIPQDILHQYLNAGTVSKLACLSKSLNETLKDLEKETVYVFMKDYITAYLGNPDSDNMKKAKYIWCNGRNRGPQKFTIDLPQFLGGGNQGNVVPILKQLCKITGLDPPPPDAEIMTMFSFGLKLEFNITYNISRRKNSAKRGYNAKIRNIDVSLYKNVDKIAFVKFESGIPNSDISGIINMSVRKWIVSFLPKMSALVLYALCSIQNLEEKELIIANGTSNVKINMNNVKDIIDTLSYEMRNPLTRVQDDDSTSEEEENVVVEENRNQRDPVRFFTENYVSSQGLLTHSQVDALIRERQLAVAFFVQSVRCSRTYYNEFVEFTLQNDVKIVLKYNPQNLTEMQVLEYSYLDTDVALRLNMTDSEAPHKCQGLVSRQEFNNICNSLQLFFTGLVVFKRRLQCKTIINRSQKIRVVMNLPRITDETVKDVIDVIETFKEEFIREKQLKIAELSKYFTQSQGNGGGRNIKQDKSSKRKKQLRKGW
jgi:hypothetical protein